MIKYILTLFLITLFSCGKKNISSLELNFTYKNSDIIPELKAFYLTSLTTKNKIITFKNVKAKTPNGFVFEHLSSDLYIGLMQIEKNGAIYNISIDSIQIKDGKNTISKEINLGTVRL